MPAPITATSVRETATRALYDSPLRPDELVHQRNALAPCDRDVVPAPRSPRDTQQIAGAREQVLDVLRAVRELIPRILVVPPLDVDAVNASPPVGIDEAPKEWLRVRLDDGLLPRDESDAPLVLSTRTMLREEAEPGAPVRRDRGEALVPVVVRVGRAPADALDRAATFRDDPVVLGVTVDPQESRPGALRLPHAPVSKVFAEQVGISLAVDAVEVVHRAARITPVGRGCGPLL